MQDGTEYRINRLLGKPNSNAKLAKSNKSQEYLTMGLSLAPAKVSGYQVCPHSTPGCRAACINTAGQGIYDNVQRCRIAKTRAFFQNRAAFLDQLFYELTLARKQARKKNKILAVRLNVFSDIPWEKICPELFAAFSDVIFYDYTKNLHRAADSWTKKFPANYRLTFSKSESNQEQVERLCKFTGVNVAVVFATADLPATYLDRPVINGDNDDMRFLDPEYVIVGLKAKGKGKKDTSGFVVSLPVIS